MKDAASPWVARWIAGVPAGGRVLDVACGRGRHIALARGLELRVTGVDRDVAAARERFPGDGRVELIAADLEAGQPFPFAAGSFDGVIVTNYLWRPILADIVAAVSPGGVLIYETFRLGNARYGKPSNPDFLLRPGELLETVRNKLHVVAYEDVTERDPARVLQRICAVGPTHPWIDVPPGV